MKRFLCFFLFIVGFLIESPCPSKAAAQKETIPPKVLVTIKPIHSLVSGVMEGIAEPQMLIEDDSSPHHHLLKPSEEQKLYNAQVIIWVGESYEGFLKKRLETAGMTASLITISKLDGLQLYPNRLFIEEEGCPADLTAEHPCPHGDHTHEISGKDGHIWLAPHNAKAIVTQVAKKLATFDRQHAPHYLANAQKMVKKIDDLARELSKESKDIKGIPYLTFHDFTQYYDRYYGTKCIGVIRANPNLPPSPKQVRLIQKQISNYKAQVLFAEPQFDDKLIKMLQKDSNIRLAQLDYLGYGLQPGPDLYFEMMRRLSFDLKKALTE